MKLPVFGAFGATYSFVFGNLIACIQIVWLPLAMLYAGFYFIADKIFPIIVALVRTMPERGEDAAEVMPFALLHLLAPLLQWQGVIFLVALVLTAIISAGLLRLVLRGERPSLPFYLGFGGAEFGLIFTWILMGLILFVAYIGFAIGVGTLAITVASLSKTLVPTTLVVALVFCAVIFLWLVLRLSLASAGSIAVRGIGIGPSWSVTRGNALRLLGFWILVFIPLIAIEWVASSFTGVYILPDVMSALPDNGEQMSNAEAADMLETLFAAIAEKLPLLLGAGFVLNLITYPVMICAGGVAFRMLQEGEG